MKAFHISDILSITTGRLVSSRHIAGVYDILNFLTGDNLFTHQLPRASRECEPYLRRRFPQLMEDAVEMKEVYLRDLDRTLDTSSAAAAFGRDEIIAKWVESVRMATGMREMIELQPLSAGAHAKIDPIAEGEQLMGAGRVVVCLNPKTVAVDI